MDSNHYELIDSHAHLDCEHFDIDRDQLIDSFKDNNICKVITVADSYKSAQKVCQLTDKYSDIYGAVGFHPHNAKEVSAKDIDNLKPMFLSNKIVAVGEIGLDYHYNFSDKPTQIDLFNKMLSLSIEVRKPVIIHNRKSDQDLISTIKDHQLSKISGVIHCFDSNLQFAKTCLDMGFYISFSGIISFKKSDQLREVVEYVPLDRILIETDCPYLSPHPNRGKRNSPLNIKYIAQIVSKIKNKPIEEIALITKDNTTQLFQLD